MAQKIQVILVDDLDGGDADESVSFALDGVSYEIDLSSKNAQKLRDALAVYVAEGRRVGGRKKSGTSRASGSRGGSDASTIREWARENGHEVSDRGRIPEEVRAAYDAAH